MKKTTLLILTTAIILIFNGCALKKMVKNSNLVSYNVNPNPLEYKAGKVPVDITINFPAKYFAKKAYLVASPVIATKDGQQELPLKSFTLQGEGVKDNNPVISYATGGSYNYKDTVAYDPKYRNSDLLIKVSVNKGGAGKNLTFATVKLAIGIITTPLLVDEGLIIDNGVIANTKQGQLKTLTPTIGLPDPKPEQEKLTLYYPLQQSKLTPAEQKKKEVDSFINNMSNKIGNTDLEFKGLTIASYASPDGPIPLNSSLVKGRGENSTDFLTNKFKAKKIDIKEKLSRQTTPDEDWEGFQKLVQESNMADKDIILRVLSMYNDPNVRETEIKKMAKVYDQLRKDILPKLRRSDILATYQPRKKTTEELIQLGLTNSDKISQDELYYAAQSASGDNKVTLWTTYTQNYPSDWRGFNNLAVEYMKQNKLTEAELQLQKAENLSQNNGTIINNLGVVYFYKGDYKKAYQYFTKALSYQQSEDIAYNIGVILIKEGKYAEAVQRFGSRPSFNKSLALLLNGQTNEALSTLNNFSSQHCHYYYLKAIIYSRLNDKNQTIANLKQAIAKNPELKDYAKEDIEFRAFFNDEDFKAIVQ